MLEGPPVSVVVPPAEVPAPVGAVPPVVVAPQHQVAPAAAHPGLRVWSGGDSVKRVCMGKEERGKER